jgi:DNA-binding transcriptional MerR regulator
MYTVKQLSELAGVSVRTLHYYDEIALLTPTQIGANGYRYYDDSALLRLQQILFYREIGLELSQIRAILDDPNFDLLAALQSHRAVILEKSKRLHELIETIDSTILHVTEAVEMSNKNLFKGFSEAKQKQYEREARLQYGPEIVNESVKRWNSYSEDEQAAIRQEGGEVYLDLARLMKKETPPNSPEVMDVLRRWHANIRYFYEPTTEILRGLGEMYNTHPDFIAFFQKIDPDLPAYLQAAITVYVDELETAEIERLLAEDDAGQLRG